MAWYMLRECGSLLCSQELEEASSEAICWDGERFAPSNGQTTLAGYCLPDSETECFHDSRSGMTCRHSMETHGEGGSMSSQVDSLAKIFPQPGKALESMALAPECGITWQGSFARFDHDSSSWKTPQLSLLEGLDVFSETWPRWGTMRNGACWERMTLVGLTNGNGFGSWPTPTRHDGKDNASPAAILRKSPGLGVVAQIWQTPTADDAVERKIGKWNSRGEPKLSAEVLIWPTPRTKGMCGGSGAWEQLKQATTIEEARKMGAGNGGQLNPPWVEWLMGWPIGWTDSQLLEMDKFRQWQQQHSAF